MDDGVSVVEVVVWGLVAFGVVVLAGLHAWWQNR